jgi:hypothetical protein
MEKEQKNSDTITIDPANIKCTDGRILHILKAAHVSRDIKTIDSILKKLEELRVNF